MTNKRKLIQNQNKPQHPDQRGAARNGHALLQGLVLCGRCGRRMHPVYLDDDTRAYYRCHADRSLENGRLLCWSVATPSIDDAVAQLFLEVVQPSEIDLGLAVVREAEHQAAEVEQQWNLRLKRAQYEARLAERRYKAVDPDNRVVAQTLEREWNEKLGELESLGREHEHMHRSTTMDLTEHERARILALSKNLSHVWNASTTTHAERKNLLRMLVEQVTLSPIDIPQRMTRVQLLWRTGAVSDFAVPRPRGREVHLLGHNTIEQIRRLAYQQKSDLEIARELNRDGFRTSQNKPWSSPAIGKARRRYGLPSPISSTHGIPLPEKRADGLYSLRGVVCQFGVTEHVARYWIKKGWLRPVEGGGLGRPLWFKLDPATVEHLWRAKARGYGSSRLRNSQTSRTSRRHHE